MSFLYRMPREFGVPAANGQPTPLMAWWQENADWVPIPNQNMIDVAEILNNAYAEIAPQCANPDPAREQAIRDALRMMFREAGNLINRIHNEAAHVAQNAQAIHAAPAFQAPPNNNENGGPPQPLQDGGKKLRVKHRKTKRRGRDRK